MAASVFSLRNRHFRDRRAISHLGRCSRWHVVRRARDRRWTREVPADPQTALTYGTVIGYLFGECKAILTSKFRQVTIPAENDASDKIVAMRKSHPEWSSARIGESVGVSREYVRQVLARAGLQTKAVRPVVRRPWDGERMTPGIAGAVGELLVVCDLLRRKIPVFRAMHPHSRVDLIALLDDNRTVKIEVRSARRLKNGKGHSYSHPSTKHHDVLALAFSDGAILYKPPIADW